jgi:hypothetical protein
MLTVVQRGGTSREKPPEVVRGYSSRLPWAWDGLCFAVPFNDATRDSARDLAVNAAPSAVTGTLAWTKDNRGNVAANLNASSGIDYAYNPAHNRPLTEVTAYVRMRRAGAGGTPRGIFLKVWNLTLDPIVSWCIQDSDAANNTLAANLGVGGVQNYWEAPGYTVGTIDWISVFLRWRSGEDPILDILGERGQILTSATYGSTLTGTIPYTTGQPIRLNTFDADGATNYNADYSQAMAWSRKLTNTEVQALVADPYGWYSPRRETLGVSSPYPLFGGESLMNSVSSG